MMKAVLPSMRERRNGHTVNITSMAAYVECTAGAAHYNSALGGIFGGWLSDQRCAMLAAHWQCMRSQESTREGYQSRGSINDDITGDGDGRLGIASRFLYAPW